MKACEPFSLTHTLALPSLAGRAPAARHRRLQWRRRDDIIFRDAGGTVVEWLMNGTQLAAPRAVMAPSPATSPLRRIISRWSVPKVPADFVAETGDSFGQLNAVREASPTPFQIEHEAP